MRRIATRSLVPMAIVGAAAVPAAASAAGGGDRHPIDAAYLHAQLTHGGGASPNLCEYSNCGGYGSARWWGHYWAGEDWAWTSLQSTNHDYCSGPFGAGHTGSTQWACFGLGTQGGQEYAWQVNVSAFGAQTYHTRSAI
jgi:hypothetical protein